MPENYLRSLSVDSFSLRGKNEVGYQPALLTFQPFAKNVGRRGMAAIESGYKWKLFSSETQYQCHPGAIVVGAVVVRGKGTKLAN
jgi:hypothetical protein